METARSQYQLRQVCVFLNLHLLNKPEVFCNAFTGNFDPDCNLVDEKIQESMLEQLDELKNWTQRLKY